jgi:hypothetical protein
MMPVLPRIPMPPAEFDHAYTGKKLTVLKEDNYAFIRYVCRDNPTAIACSYRIYDNVSDETLSCLIMLGPMAHDDPQVLRHEIGHCNGWPSDHPGARWPMLTLQSLIVIAVGWSAIRWHWTETRLATIIGFVVAYLVTVGLVALRH